jgi:leader peptidase (prepilin peptidase)/N-methyltransferase
MPIAWWGLVGLFAALLINRAADCWLSPARLQCGLTRHPVRQGAVWIALPLLFMALAWRTPDASHPGAMCLFAAVLVLLAVIDREQRRVPNVVLLPSVTLVLWLAWQGNYLASAAAGAALAMLMFAGLYAIGRRFYGPGALGLGDVKLAGLIGAMTGMAWMPYALFLGILLAGAAAAVMLLTGRARRGDTLPYGHFMALAALLVLVVQT